MVAIFGRQRIQDYTMAAAMLAVNLQVGKLVYSFNVTHYLSKCALVHVNPALLLLFVVLTLFLILSILFCEFFLLNIGYCILHDRSC